MSHQTHGISCEMPLTLTHPKTNRTERCLTLVIIKNLAKSVTLAL